MSSKQFSLFIKTLYRVWFCQTRTFQHRPQTPFSAPTHGSHPGLVCPKKRLTNHTVRHYSWERLWVVWSLRLHRTLTTAGESRQWYHTLGQLPIEHLFVQESVYTRGKGKRGKLCREFRTTCSLSIATVLTVEIQQCAI